MNIIQWVKKVRKKFSPSPLVLMYHRVNDPAIDPWQLSVTAANFEQQLQVLKETGLVAPISKVVEQFYSKKKTSPSIAITFDDGYVDNYTYAKPLLEKYNLPATFFICTEHVGKAKEFWWDELAHLVLLSQKLPPSLSISINNTSFTFDLNEEQNLSGEIYQKHQLWNGYRKPSTRRSQLYMNLWQLLSTLTNQKQECLLSELRKWAGIIEPSREKNYAMSKDQLTSLAAGELFNIGAHTVSHPMLTGYPKNVQSEEIAQSKYFLEVLLDRGIDIFAYPSGDFNDITVEVLKQQGFKAAFTTDAKPVKFKDSPFRIGRYQVNNWPRAEFKQVMSPWLN